LESADLVALIRVEALTHHEFVTHGGVCGPVMDDSVYGRIVRLFMNGGVIQAVEERATMVSGHVTGNTLTLSGTFSGSAGVRDEEILENWTTMVEAGRMDGTYDHRHIQQGSCFLDRCIDPIVWRRNYRVIELHRTNGS
jgi:hypothetical protein